MDTNQLLIMLYATVLSGSTFMLVSFGRLSIREIRARRSEGVRILQLRLNAYLMFNLAFMLLAGALIGVASTRVMDGLAGRSIAGTWPEALVASMGLLAAAMTLFHWAQTLGKARWPWRLFLFVTVSGIAWLSLWLYL